MAVGRRTRLPDHRERYAEIQHLCRETSLESVNKTIALMDCEDPHVALVAQEQIRLWAWGKPKEYDPKAVAPETLSDAELDAAIVRTLIQMGLPARRAAQLAAAAHELRDEDNEVIEGEATVL